MRASRRRGALAADDLHLAACQFVEMIKGDLHLRALLCAADPPAPGEIERHVRAAIGTFLDGVARR